MFVTLSDTITVDDIALLDDPALVEALRATEHARRRLEATQARIVHELDHRKTHRRDGHASVCGLIRTITKRPTPECQDLIRTGKLLHDHADIATAMDTGELGVAQAHRLARAKAHPRCGDQFPDAADVLLDAAITKKWRDFETDVDRWINLADTDGADQRAQANHTHRDFWIHVGADGYMAQAQGGVIQGTAIAEIHARYLQAEWDKDWAWTRAKHGDQACASLMPRSNRERRADAFSAMCEAAVSTPTGARPPEPVVNLLTDAATLCKLLTIFFGVPVTPEQDAQAADVIPITARRCETTTGVAVAPVELLAALLAGHIRRVVLDSHSVPIDMGRTQRLFTGNARIAAHMGIPRCIWPGCEVPAARCQTDHLTEWIRHGTTSPHDGAPGCPGHNLFKHNHGYRITRAPDGTLHTYRPDGTEVA